MNENARYCEMLVRESDRDRYLATLFAPQEKRGALHAINAFNVELVRVRGHAREPMPGEIRLQWWREVLDGKRDDEAQANPVAAALLDAIETHGLARGMLQAVIDARSFDLYDAPFETIAEWERYAQDTDGGLLTCAMQVLAGAAAESGVIAHAARALAGLTVLQHLPQHLSRGQCYVPREMLDHFGAGLEDGLEGRVTPEWQAALAELRLRIRRNLDAATQIAGCAPQAALPALLPCALVRPSLELMDANRYDPLRPEILSPWRRQWLIWRAARNPKRIFG